MAVTPQQAKEAYDKANEESFRQTERNIDVALCGGTRTFSSYLIPSKIRDQILKRYTSYGWKITYVGDTRESYYKFEEA